MQCPRCASDWVRPGYCRGAWDRLCSAAKLQPFRCQSCAHRFRRYHGGPSGLPGQPDRREFERIPASFPVFFWNADQHGEGTIGNISAAGCWVAGPAAVTAGTPLEILLQPGGQSVDAPGVVARVVPSKGFAVEFLNPSPDHRLRMLLQACRTKAARPVMAHPFL